MNSSIKSYFTKALTSTMFAATLAGCSVDRHPTGPEVSEGLATIISTCQPRVLWEVPGHPNVQPVFRNITDDHCGGLSPEEGEFKGTGKYMCPALLDSPHAVVGNIYAFQLEDVVLTPGATAADSAMANEIRGPGFAHHGQIITVETYPKYALFDGKALTAPIAEYNVEAGTGWGDRFVLQEGTYIVNAEDIDKNVNLPTNIKDSNAVQVQIGNFLPNARGLHGVLQSGRLVARVALPAAGGGYTHEVRSTPAHTWYVPQTGLKTIQNPFYYMGSIDDHTH